MSCPNCFKEGCTECTSNERLHRQIVELRYEIALMNVMLKDHEWKIGAYKKTEKVKTAKTANKDKVLPKKGSIWKWLLK